MIEWTHHWSGDFGREAFTSSRGRSRFVFYVNKAAEPLSRCYEYTAFEMRHQDIGGRRLYRVATGFSTAAAAKAAAEAALSDIRKAAR